MKYNFTIRFTDDSFTVEGLEQSSADKLKRALSTSKFVNVIINDNHEILVNTDNLTFVDITAVNP